MEHKIFRRWQSEIVQIAFDAAKEIEQIERSRRGCEGKEYLEFDRFYGSEFQKYSDAYPSTALRALFKVYEDVYDPD